MTRVYNFSAGPAALPEPVLRQAAAEMLDWQGSGMSVMEMSHRGKGSSPSTPGAAPAARAAGRAVELQDPVHAGWCDRRERHRADEPAAAGVAPTTSTPADGQSNLDQGSAQVLRGQRRGERSRRLHQHPARDELEARPERRLRAHLRQRTIGGVEYHFTPEVGEVPLVADVSSNILARPVDVSKYGLIYGGAQKNIGPAGLTIVIVRDDLLGRSLPVTPSAFDYGAGRSRLHAQHAAHLRDLHRRAGVQVDQGARRPGGDGSAQPRQGGAAVRLPRQPGLLLSPIGKNCRSLMNVPFRLRDATLDAQVPRGRAGARHELQLKGHRVVGGMRASIYNAMPIEGVQALVAYLKNSPRSTASRRRGRGRRGPCVLMGSRPANAGFPYAARAGVASPNSLRELRSLRSDSGDESAHEARVTARRPDTTLLSDSPNRPHGAARPPR